MVHLPFLRVWLREGVADCTNAMHKIVGIPEEIVHNKEAYSDYLVEKLLKYPIAIINFPRHDYSKYQQHTF